jgi:hypothetical protein
MIINFVPNAAAVGAAVMSAVAGIVAANTSLRDASNVWLHTSRRKIDVCGIMRFLSVIGSGTGADRNAGLAVVQFGLHSRLAASEVREFLPVSAHRDK